MGKQTRLNKQRKLLKKPLTTISVCNGFKIDTLTRQFNITLSSEQIMDSILHEIKFIHGEEWLKDLQAPIFYDEGEVLSRLNNLGSCHPSSIKLIKLDLDIGEVDELGIKCEFHCSYVVGFLKSNVFINKILKGNGYLYASIWEDDEYLFNLEDDLGEYFWNFYSKKVELIPTLSIEPFFELSECSFEPTDEAFCVFDKSENLLKTHYCISTSDFYLRI